MPSPHRATGDAANGEPRRGRYRLAANPDPGAEPAATRGDSPPAKSLFASSRLQISPRDGGRLLLHLVRVIRRSPRRPGRSRRDR